MKGEYNDICNRSACSNSNAVYYNFSTRKFYCKHCANQINALNFRDAFNLYGHDLCLRYEPVEHRNLNHDGGAMGLWIEVIDYFDENYPHLEIVDLTEVFFTKDKPLSDQGESYPFVIIATTADNKHIIEWPSENKLITSHNIEDLVMFAPTVLNATSN